MELIKPGIFFQKNDSNAYCVLDEPDKNINTLSENIVSGLSIILEKIKQNNGIKTLYIRSAKQDCFCAGADIKIFDTFKLASDGQNASLTLNHIFSTLESLKISTVALIHGTCLGGGLELALACQYRIATPESQFGLPEIQLGIIPGGGGTYRLPKLIGLINSLDLILTGKKISSKKAEVFGLVDLIVPAPQLQDIFELKLNQILKIKKIKSNSFFKNFLMDKNPIYQKMIKKKSLEQINKNTKGFYPAPFKALECVLSSINSSREKAIEKESKYFGELSISKESQALVYIFKMLTEKKKNPFDVKEKSDEFIKGLISGSHSVGILGAGLMGSGIATVLAENNIRSVLVDKSSESLSKGLESIRKHFSDKMNKKRINKSQFETAIQNITPSTHYSVLKGSEFIIEAVFEDVNIKKEVLKTSDNEIGKRFVFATNTSSICISEIAADYKNSENVIGMHFFSPVPKMPLIEIIKTDKTSNKVLSDTFQLSKLMKKNVIIVNDSPGFFTTRVLAFYLSEAMQLLSEGASITEIDLAMESIGFPVGPLTLIDEVGIDVGIHILNVLKPHFFERLIIPKEIDSIIKSGRKGRKNSYGFYIYKGGKKLEEDKSVYQIFKPSKLSKPNREDIINRCLYVFLNESAYCLENKVIGSQTDADFGSIFGLGFPPFLGGPLHYARSIGVNNVHNMLDGLYKKYGNQFKPSQVWKSF